MVLVLAHAFCNVSVMPLRAEPDHRAEQTSQLLFGEGAEIIETNNREWAFVSCTLDGYKGWCKLSQLTIVSAKEYRKPLKYHSASHNGKLIINNSDMWLPLGCDLRLKVAKMLPEGTMVKYKGKKMKVGSNPADSVHINNISHSYLNAPYQWGGRSVQGIDCSGLTQMVFKLCGQKLPRDASEQALEGKLVDFLQNAHCGDLAFFDNKEGKIVHVGILLDSQTIIHATDTCGRVVIDKIDQGGVISVSLRKRTHNLRFVKRILRA